MKTKRSETPWAEVGGRAQAPRRKELHRDPAGRDAMAETTPPERPDDEAANRFLVKARREMAMETR
jgi:hypothetical protein